MPPRLSKSRFVVGHQCHRRLWWETHDREAPELVRSAAEQAILDHGRHVGEVAQRYVPGGVLIDAPHTEPKRRVAETRAAMNRASRVIYEASFFQDDIFVAVDILHRNASGWTLTEVKSTTRVKPEHLLDAAVQTHVLRRAGLPVRSVEIMHLDQDCEFPDLSNLFHRQDVTDEVEELLPAIPREARRQLEMLQGPLPDVPPDDNRCYSPYECPFLSRCWEPAPEHHVGTLYRIRRRKAAQLVEDGYETIDELPDEMELGDIAERQRRAIRDDRLIVEPGLAAALQPLEEPVAYLDFETLNLPIPCWPGCHPYDQVPVQLSVHHDSGQHYEWIADSPEDPREELALALIEAVRGARTIAAYNSPFERRCIEGLRSHLPHLAKELDDIIERLVDLLPIVRNHVYHPGFNGSFSLKSVYPALVGRNGYDGLDVADGGTASVELERLMFDAELGEDERETIRSSLLQYCGMDTQALVEMVATLREVAERRAGSAVARDHGDDPHR